MISIICRKTSSLLYMLVIFIGICGLAIAGSNGINLPPTQGSTNDGAFDPGVYSYTYTDNAVANISNANLTHIRIPINVETANDSASLDKIKNYFFQVGYKGIIVMFDTRQPGEPSHGNGRPNNHWQMALAWRKIHGVFKDYPNVKYEIFNEPFGYNNNATWYIADMEYLIDNGKLPKSKCILDGLGYAGDVQVIKDLWSGDLAYHFYPDWLQGSSATQSGYSNLFQNDLAGVSHRTHITEFGANLLLGDVYNTYTNSLDDEGRNINTLRGMHDAVIALRDAGNAIKSSYYWHGWAQKDRFSLWYNRDGGNSYSGRQKVLQIQADSGGGGGVCF